MRIIDFEDVRLIHLLVTESGETFVYSHIRPRFLGRAEKGDILGYMGEGFEFPVYALEDGEFSSHLVTYA